MATSHFQFSWRIAALALAWSPCGFMVSTTAAAEPAVVAGTDQIPSWIDELDSDQYVVRERAMLKLRGAGATALEPLAKAADSSSFERASASVRLLLELSESEDPAASLAALQRIAALRNRPTERAVAEAILHGMREKRAIAEIRRLGAVEQGQYVVDGQIVITQLKLGEEWQGGDDGMKYLKELSSLQVLLIHGTPITDKGIEHLHELKSVAQIQIYGTSASDAGIEALRKALPQIEVHYRRGAFLGVGAVPNPQGAQVTEVRPDSAAQAAGIVPGDIITKFNGQAVKDFESLTGFIAKCKGGDKATLEFIRGQETLTREVTFGKWR